MKWLDGITIQPMDMSLSRLPELDRVMDSWLWTGKPDVLQSMGSQRVRYNLTTEQQQMCGKRMHSMTYDEVSVFW